MSEEDPADYREEALPVGIRAASGNCSAGNMYEVGCLAIVPPSW